MGLGLWMFLALLYVPLFHFHGFSLAEKAPYYSFVHEATVAPEVSFFDYIIVGGGTAGCPLAATLSEKASVLMLERGGCRPMTVLASRTKGISFPIYWIPPLVRIRKSSPQRTEFTTPGHAFAVVDRSLTRGFTRMPNPIS
ncbi:hypothetical protein V6N11_014678 [Hibiscus sabdariffa]|uniref:Glucose-methanol-choline oxidoreductase N-terminal domain-containing protein n=1 Tax=Hibiscus sabdariffa TaxID=183260 RepID=A0ABR2TPS8_9ROSI